MPDPANLYERVSIGDVGYIKDGYFVRKLLDWSIPSNYALYSESSPESQPDNYVCLEMGPFNQIRQATLSKGVYYSRFVQARVDE